MGVWVSFSTSALLARQTGSVAGIVTDTGSLRPVAEARVFIAGTSSQAHTDEKGGYLLAGLPARGGRGVPREAGIRSCHSDGRGHARRDGGPRRTGGDGHRSSALPRARECRRRHPGERRAGARGSRHAHEPPPGAGRRRTGAPELRHGGRCVCGEDPGERLDQPERHAADLHRRLEGEVVSGWYPHTPLQDMSIPAFLSPCVAATVPSTSTWATGPGPSIAAAALRPTPPSTRPRPLPRSAA